MEGTAQDSHHRLTASCITLRGVPNKGSLAGLNPCRLAGPACRLGEVPGAEACSLRLFLCNSGIQWAKRDSLQHDWKMRPGPFAEGEIPLQHPELRLLFSPG